MLVSNGNVGHPPLHNNTNDDCQFKYLQEDEASHNEYHCANCGLSNKDAKLLICRECFNAGRHKLPDSFTTRFCSYSCYKQSLLNSHQQIHRRLSEEQLEEHLLK